MGLDPSIEIHKSSQSVFSLRYCNSKIWFPVKNKKSPSQSQCQDGFVVTIWSWKLCLNAYYQTLPFLPDVSCVVSSTSCTGFLRRRLRLLVVGPFVFGCVCDVLECPSARRVPSGACIARLLVGRIKISPTMFMILKNLMVYNDMKSPKGPWGHGPLEDQAPTLVTFVLLMCITSMVQTQKTGTSSFDFCCAFLGNCFF